ncbi:hypothetical protein JOL79_00030 [Microbispora sp. RL4-1S]|uniref:Protein-L-isoaspartate O-methyltransferase n=1 Tax=Microbispora oryzae TaxID=2806554 RepID=A0A940WB54_9ACTN|nr:hypothetical protein [Microbispora oryzae]MBP2702184.1 hypothetical protein [Microbispora oryzae]
MFAAARSPESADRLRADLVTALKERGSIRSPEVAEAVAKVPRERFAPEAPLDAAYSVWDVVVTKRDADGKATSSISAPWLQAEMLEGARLTRGARVLEIGSGGYNAALIAEIVGPDAGSGAWTPRCAGSSPCRGPGRTRTRKPSSPAERSS